MIKLEKLTKALGWIARSKFISEEQLRKLHLGVVDKNDRAMHVLSNREVVNAKRR